MPIIGWSPGVVLLSVLLQKIDGGHVDEAISKTTSQKSEELAARLLDSEI